MSAVCSGKNLAFLVDAVAQFLLRNPAARFLLVGEGPTREEMLGTLARLVLCTGFTCWESSIVRFWRRLSLYGCLRLRIAL